MTCTSCTTGTVKPTPASKKQEFKFVPLLHHPVPETEYERQDDLSDAVTISETADGHKIALLKPGVLDILTQRAYENISHKFRPAHLQRLVDAYNRPGASDNDRMVIRALLENATVASDGVLPACQDTGNALVYGWKGRSFVSLAPEEHEITRGVFNAYTQNNLRYSQTAPLDMYKEQNTRNNLPVQVDVFSEADEAKSSELDLLFVAKGGGSANKSALFQKTKALLNPNELPDFIKGVLKGLGTSACPPYYFSICIGGSSAEKCLEVAKLASTRQLDTLPLDGPRVLGEAFRDTTLEKQIMEMSQQLGIGAQFDGSVFLLDARVVRMARHGASCPVGIAVSCSADRNIRARVNADGVFLERLESNPKRFLDMIKPDVVQEAPAADEEKEEASTEETTGKALTVELDLSEGMEAAYKRIRGLPIGTQVLLTGPIVIARDIAHARLRERLHNGEKLPQYIMDHPVYFAGPAKTPDGYVTGSVGPTTSQRMDTYTDEFIKHGGHLITIGKGNRPGIPDNAVYLAALGGAAAVPANPDTCQFTSIETIEYEELGMEAVRLAQTKKMPTVLIANGEGDRMY